MGPDPTPSCFENILANSLKYAAAGDVQVTISNDANNLIQVQVRDEGIGITPEDRARAFEPYYRSPDAIKHKIEGTGLGLFISRGIVEAHGGTLTLESLGTSHGTTATVTLPRHVTEGTANRQ